MLVSKLNHQITEIQIYCLNVRFCYVNERQGMTNEKFANNQAMAKVI